MCAWVGVAETHSKVTGLLSRTYLTNTFAENQMSEWLGQQHTMKGKDAGNKYPCDLMLRPGGEVR